MIKTYVWISATPSSKPKRITNITIGKINPIELKFSSNNMLQENPIITFSKLCPAIKLINNRTPKLIGFAMYDINSIGTSSNANKNVVFVGRNKENIFILYFSKVIMFIPINTEKDKRKVTIKWLVAVKLYGTNPIKLLKRIKLNKIEIIGKYFSLSIEIMSEISWAVISDIDSILFCQEFGVKKKDVSCKQFLWEAL